MVVWLFNKNPVVVVVVVVVVDDVVVVGGGVCEREREFFLCFLTQ